MRRMKIIRHSARHLNYINTTLAKKMAGDGEGATALFEVKIVGAESKEQASNFAVNPSLLPALTKAAIYRT